MTDSKMTPKTDLAAGAPTTPKREVPIAWEALEDAFENNAPEVHSYLQLATGEVIRVVDGIADPGMHARIGSDAGYLRIDPVSSREQYRWMERFIATVEESEFRTKLVAAIDGKGAFRRFKDVLMAFPVERERWFTFRSERLRTCMEAWLETHGLHAVVRPQWEVPSADDVRAQAEREEAERPGRRTRADLADLQRRRLNDLVEALPARDLDAALAFLEFLRDRRHVPHVRLMGEGGPRDGAIMSGHERDDDDDDDHGSLATDGPLETD
jgi:hypothetical protein